MNEQKHYILFAAEIAAEKGNINEETRRYAAKLIARLCAKDNPRFDWHKFMQACDLE